MKWKPQHQEIKEWTHTVGILQDNGLDIINKSIVWGQKVGVVRFVYIKNTWVM